MRDPFKRKQFNTTTNYAYIYKGNRMLELIECLCFFFGASKNV